MYNFYTLPVTYPSVTLSYVTTCHSLIFTLRDFVSDALIAVPDSCLWNSRRAASSIFPSHVCRQCCSSAVQAAGHSSLKAVILSESAVCSWRTRFSPHAPNASSDRELCRGFEGGHSCLDNVGRLLLRGVSSASLVSHCCLSSCWSNLLLDSGKKNPHKLQSWSIIPENSSSPYWSQHSCFWQGCPYQCLVHSASPSFKYDNKPQRPICCSCLPLQKPLSHPAADSLPLQRAWEWGCWLWQRRAQQKSKWIGLLATLRWRSSSRPSNTASGGLSTPW